MERTDCCPGLCGRQPRVFSVPENAAPFRCGNLSADKSDAHSSAELSAGESVLVHCDNGYVHDRSDTGDVLKVVGTEPGAFSGHAYGSNAAIYLSVVCGAHGPFTDVDSYS